MLTPLLVYSLEKSILDGIAFHEPQCNYLHISFESLGVIKCLHFYEFLPSISCLFITHSSDLISTYSSNYLMDGGSAIKLITVPRDVANIHCIAYHFFIHNQQTRIRERLSKCLFTSVNVFTKGQPKYR
jgi:hypothetical protein